MAAPKFPELEESILKEWEDKKIFEKSLAKPSPKGEFVVYEGPPTANGKPGIHHVLARAFKDLIPRFRTMQGYHVARKAGWDTHGLPVELEVEKKLGLKSKKDVEAYGMEKFNAECRASVWTYRDEWERMTKRMGYWLDMAHPYVTYENGYVEKVWGVLTEVWKKKLIYKGHRVTPHCPRCDTSLSSHELAQGYKDTQDPSVFVKFSVVGADKEFFLVWTTTPWTLPSNVALAVGKDIVYVKAKLANGDVLILAKERLGELSDAHEVIEEMPGKKLAAMSYTALFDMAGESKTAYKAYLADFVSTSEGTGIVHIAPAYGEDDYALGQAEDLPTVFGVDHTGMMIADVPGKGKFFKKADDDIKADLEARGLLYKSGTITHSYPFCWRCGTPILYLAKDSWYIAMSKLRDKLIASNEKVNWVPEHIKDGRFGEWLKGLKDWAISRERYWGTPLPIWECANGHQRVVGSLEEMDEAAFRKNRFFVVRHGQAASNVGEVLSSWPEVNGDNHLTDEGKRRVQETAKDLKKEKVDMIVSSDILRTKETAEIIQEATGAELKFDPRLREIGVGSLNGKSEDEYRTFFNGADRFTKRPDGGENFDDVRARVMAAVLELDRTHQGKTIVIVSHGDPVWFLFAGMAGAWHKAVDDVSYPQLGKAVELHVPNWPFDGRGAVDVHRPFIDAVTLKCEECKEEMKRVPEVMDVWFDSGAMPFAAGVEYPADFISEAIDQTRGWFYTLMAVGTLMGKPSPYKNVICLGHILDTKGQKMSKSKGNVVDPWKMFEKYGSDAVRFHLYTVNQPGDPKRFDEKEVDSVVKKVFLILWNCLSFWKMYANDAPAEAKSPKVTHMLDKWILSELGGTNRAITFDLEAYDVVTAGRILMGFINDLSTWYVRRSRDRFKVADNSEAVATLGYVLLTLSKLMAPFTPFVAERLYKELGGSKESVHLEDWPVADTLDDKLAFQMQHVRYVVSMALEARAKAGINVRQALSKLEIVWDKVFEDWMLSIIAEEVNVKYATYEKGTIFEVRLDTALTPELKREGATRDLTRNLNALRKEGGLTINDKIVIHYETESTFWKEVMKEHAETIKTDARATGLNFGKVSDMLKETEIEFDAQKMWIGIVKA